MRITLNTISRDLDTYRTHQSTVVCCFCVDFTHEACSGRGRICHEARQAVTDWPNAAAEFEGRTIEVTPVADAVRNFEPLGSTEAGAFRPLASPFDFLFVGRLKEHAFVGTVFSHKDIDIIIPADSVPEYALELEVGTWIRAELINLSFWIR